MKKNTKSILAIVLMMIVVLGIFTACKGKGVDETNGTTEDISVSDTTAADENTTENTTEPTTESTTAETTTQQAQATKAQSTNKPAPKPAEKQTQKQTTTKKVTTTTQKAVTTTKKAVKNVTAKEVQAQANAYLKSKGFVIDSSLNPNNSSWRGQICDFQEDLNSGLSLSHCKGYADIVYKEEVSQNGYKPKEIAAYCYHGKSPYSNETYFYILYLPGGGEVDWE